MPFFDHPVKNKQEVYEKLIEMSKSDDYTAGNLFDFPYHQNYYKHIGADLSRQTNTNIHQQTIFTGTLEIDDDVTMFSIAGKEQKAILLFSLDSLVVPE